MEWTQFHSNDKINYTMTYHKIENSIFKNGFVAWKIKTQNSNDYSMCKIIMQNIVVVYKGIWQFSAISSYTSAMNKFQAAFICWLLSNSTFLNSSLMSFA